MKNISKLDPKIEAILLNIPFRHPEKVDQAIYNDMTCCICYEAMIDSRYCTNKGCNI